jgi:hypothetical protein
MTEVSLIVVGKFDPEDWGFEEAEKPYFSIFHGDFADILLLEQDLSRRFPQSYCQWSEVQWSTSGLTKWALTVWLERKEAIQVQLIYS